MIFAVSAGMPLHAASSEKKENKTVASEDALPSLALDGLPDVWIQGTPVKEWAVSYTHLDVYKRQVWDEDGAAVYHAGNAVYLFCPENEQERPFLPVDHALSLIHI